MVSQLKVIYKYVLTNICAISWNSLCFWIIYFFCYNLYILHYNSFFCMRKKYVYKRKTRKCNRVPKGWVTSRGPLIQGGVDMHLRSPRADDWLCGMNYNILISLLDRRDIREVVNIFFLGNPILLFIPLICWSLRGELSEKHFSVICLQLLNW